MGIGVRTCLYGCAAKAMFAGKLRGIESKLYWNKKHAPDGLTLFVHTTFELLWLLMLMWKPVLLRSSVLIFADVRMSYECSPFSFKALWRPRCDFGIGSLQLSCLCAK